MRKTLIITLNALFICLVVFITIAHSAQTEPTGLAERRVQLTDAIDGFPESAQELLRSVVLSDDFVGVFSTEQAQELSALMGRNPRNALKKKQIAVMAPGNEDV